jgi:hypothetical protein
MAWANSPCPPSPLLSRGCAVNGAVSDRNILSAIVIPLKENTLTTAITHTRAVEGNILSALGFIRFAKRGNENSLIGTVTDLSIIKAQGLLCAAISLGEQSLSSLTLAVNRCTANRAIGDRNILSAIVIRLKEKYPDQRCCLLCCCWR